MPKWEQNHLPAMKNKIGFRKSFHLSIIRLFIFSFSSLYCVWHDNILYFCTVDNMTILIIALCNFHFQICRINRVTIWNIKWHNFSSKVMQFSSHFFHTYNFLHIIFLHIQWYIWDPTKTERIMARESGKDRLGQVLSRNSRGYWALPLMTPRWISTN